MRHDESARLDASGPDEQTRNLSDSHGVELSAPSMDDQTRELSTPAMVDLGGSISDQGSVTDVESVEEEAPEPAFDALEAYRQALDLYRTRQYDAALDRFAEVIERVPGGDRADNAQYWIGECHYGLGRWRPALAAFTRVFAYRKTEKADDAQLKIARCYLNLGEKEQALTAFRKLLDEYADSEYAEAARKEMGYLQGP